MQYMLLKAIRCILRKRVIARLGIKLKAGNFMNYSLKKNGSLKVASLSDLHKTFLLRF